MTAGRDIVLEKATTRAPETGSNGGTTASSRPPVSAWNRRKKSPSSPYTTRRKVARGTSNTVSISTSLIAAGRAGGGARRERFVRVDAGGPTRQFRRRRFARARKEPNARRREGVRGRARAASSGASLDRATNAPARDRGAERGGGVDPRGALRCAWRRANYYRRFSTARVIAAVWRIIRRRAAPSVFSRMMAPAGSREQLGRK